MSMSPRLFSRVLIVLILIAHVFSAASLARADRVMAETLFESGMAKFDEKDYEKAVLLFTKAVEEDGNYPHPLFYMGKSYEQLKKKDEADAAFRSCHKLLIEQQATLTKEEEALKKELDVMFLADTKLERDWVTLNGDTVKTLCDMAEKYMAGKHINAAQKALEIALSLEPENVRANALIQKLDSIGGRQIIAFDGETLDGWSVLPGSRQEWLVVGGCLTATTDTTATLMYQKAEANQEFTVRGRASFGDPIVANETIGVSIELGYLGDDKDYLGVSISEENVTFFFHQSQNNRHKSRNIGQTSMGTILSKNQFFDFVVYVKGNNILVKVNGKTVVNKAHEGLKFNGKIGLSVHNTSCRFKDVVFALK